MRKKKIIPLIVLLMLLFIVNISPVKVMAANNMLSINWGNIGSVGTQLPRSDSCGCFSLAYCRTILDNRVHTWNEYDYNRMNNQYNSCAWWSKAGYNYEHPNSRDYVLTRMYDSINSGRPCIVRVAGNRSSYHYVAVVGYENVTSVGALDESKFLIIDPCPGTTTSYAENMAGVGYKLLNVSNWGYELVTTNGGGVVGNTTGNVTSNPHNPIGYLDSAIGGDGKLTVNGWALDYDDTNAAIEVHIYVGGPVGSNSVVWATNGIYANQPRGDVNTALGGSVGNNHGFSVTLDVPFTGTYPVYAYAINIKDKDSANCNSILTNAPRVATVKSAIQACSLPNISYEDIVGGKKVKISAAADEIVHYAIKKDGIATVEGTSLGSYTASFSEEGKYEVTAHSSKNGKTDSGKQTKSTTISKVEAPDIIQNVTGTGIILNMQSATSGAEIYYTLSNNTPTISSTKYSGAILVDTKKVAKAIAVKPGYVNSEISTCEVILKEPDAPENLKLDTANKVPVGDVATVSWTGNMTSASYCVTMYKEGRAVKSSTTTGNSMSFELSEVGIYEFDVYGINFVGNSEVCANRVSVESKAPVKVDVCDWDGSLISSLSVPYGKSITLPEEPIRKGHTFVSWINGDKINQITEDLTVTANYKINTYSVRFYDASGNQVGATQRVEYGSEASSPDELLSDIPTGYVFSGWKVIECASDSNCDYQFVDSDMKLKAIYYWENENLPIVNEITDAKWDSETGNYNITVRLTNYPTDITTALLRVSLYTSQGKMVKSSKTEFDVLSDSVTEKTITLKYNGTATIAKACVLGINGNDLTGTALSCEASSTITCVSDYVWTNWDSWTTTKPETGNNIEIEEKTQYRYADKTTTTSSTSSMAGWTLYNTTQSWSAWGAWSDWSENHREPSDYLQREGRTIYRYYCFYCPACGGREPYQGRSDCHNYTLTLANGQVKWSTVPYSACNPQGYSYTTAKKWTTSLGDGLRWNLSTADIGHTDVGYCGDAGEPIIRYQTRYRTRSLNTTYYYYKWNDWSQWGDTPVTASDSRKIETRKVYRTRTLQPVISDLTGTEEEGKEYTISGALKFTDPDFAGKLATVMVYKGKNTDPNEDQIQYISQTTIGEGNTYSFTIIAKADPTLESGDYTVCLGIEGATGLINVDMIQAPKPDYTVTFVDDEGNILSSQTVKEGENAEIPEYPEKAGFQFIGWDQNATNISENMIIVAQYIPIQYVVTFIDGQNNIVEYQTYNYGELLECPVDPVADGKIFSGWYESGIEDGKENEGIRTESQIPVLKNMILYARYESQTYEVSFVDDKGSVVSTQTVAYGMAAVPPAALDIEGKIFLGWSTENTWWNVTEDMSVKPIVAYIETTDAPSYYIVELDDSIAVYLESNTTDANIYYSLNDEIPNVDSSKYTDNPILIPYAAMTSELFETDTEYTIALSTRLNAIAISEGRNDSEVQEIVFDTVKTYSLNQEVEINLDVNGGNELSNSVITAVENEWIGTLPTPTRSGYEFLGWFTDPEAGEQITEESVVSENCTIYAHWERQCSHSKTELRNAKDPTSTADGYTGDTYCKDCGQLIQKGTTIPKVSIDENATQIVVDSVKATAGKELILPVRIVNNPGIAGLSFDINYDHSVLTLNSISQGSILSTGLISTNANVVNWYTSDNEYGDGIILNLSFDVSEDAEPGTTNVSIALHNGDENLVDEEATFIDAVYVTGKIEIVTGMLGDLNGDEKITIGDVVLLNRHVLRGNVLGADKLPFADINHDNKITIGDVVLLNRHLLGKTDIFATTLSGQSSVVFAERLYAANTATGMTFRVEDMSVDAGSQISVPVKVEGNTGFAGLALTIEAPEGFVLNSMTAGELLAGGTFSADKNNCTWYTLDNVTSDGIVLMLNMTVADDAKTGEIVVRVKDDEPNNVADENGMTVSAGFASGTITVNEPVEEWDCNISGHKGGTATCIDKAVCEECGEEYGTVDLTNHVGDTEIRDDVLPTCETNGYTGNLYCIACSTVLENGEVISKLNHSWNDGEITTVPTCTEAGIKTYTCTVCDVTKTEEIEATGHQNTELRGELEAECNVKGYTGDIYCVDCGTLLEEGTEIEVLQHVYDYDVTVEPGCVENGVMTYTCEYCGDTYTEEIPAEGHDYYITTIDPDCVNNGYTSYECLVCGDYFEDGFIEAVGHRWDEGYVSLEATDEDPGEMTYTCTECQEQKTEEIPAYGHEYDDGEVLDEPTCTEEGTIIYTCDCGASYTESISALGHDYGCIGIVEATCTENGYSEYECANCGDYYTDDIVEATGHMTAVISGKAATCTEAGLTDGAYCEVCDEILVEQDEIPATGHTEKIDSAVKVTCTTDGKTEGKSCAVCGEVIVAQEIILATGHTVVIDAAKDPTYTATGLTEGSHCSVCKAVLVKQNSIAKLPQLSAPVLISATNAANGVTVKWNKVNKAPMYRVYRKLGATGSWGRIVDTDKLTYTDTTAVSGKEYYYTVRCLDSDKSTLISGYDKAGVKTTFLSKVTVSKVANAVSGMNVTWNKVSGATGYVVYRADGDGGYHVIKTIKDPSVVTYADTTATKNGQKYTFAVRAYKGSYKGTYTAKVYYRMARHTIASVTNSATRTMTVKWNKNSYATGYQVLYRTGGVDKIVTIKSNTTLSTVISSLTKGTTYSVYVRGYKTVSGVNYYSTWSAAKKVTITK